MREKHFRSHRLAMRRALCLLMALSLLFSLLPASASVFEDDSLDLGSNIEVAAPAEIEAVALGDQEEQAEAAMDPDDADFAYTEPEGEDEGLLAEEEEGDDETLDAELPLEEPAASEEDADQADIIEEDGEADFGNVDDADELLDEEANTDRAEAEEEAIMALSGVFVSFMIGGQQYDQVETNASNLCEEPLDPPESMYPAGMHSFLGWFLTASGSPDDVSFDFTQPVMAGLTLHARFSDRYLVKFINDEGVVVHSVLVPAGGQVPAATAAQVVAEKLRFPSENAAFQHWYETNPQTAVGFPLTVNRNYSLRPYFQNEYYLMFISDGTVVPLQTYRENQPTVRPADPTRAGYTFVRWVYENNKNVEYTFGQPLTGDVLLRAVWTPAMTTYTIVYWLEKANFAGTPDPDAPGGISAYAYEYSESASALSGTMSNVTGMSSAAQNSSLAMRTSEFQVAHNTEILGHGHTVVNVYCKRKVYTVTFDLDSGSYAASMAYNGKTYTNNGEAYQIGVKYGQDIRAIWPYSGNAVFNYSNPNGNMFAGWMHNGATNSPLDTWSTNRLAFTDDMLPKDLSSNGYIVKAFWFSAVPKRVNYWLEQLPGETGQTYTYMGKIYVRSPKHSIDQYYSGGPMVQPKAIEGTVNIFRDFNDTVSPTVFDFVYDRNRYTLSFDTQGGSTIADIPNIMFEESLANKRPADPTKVYHGFTYTFQGWYLDPGFYQPFDFATTIMPDADVKLFAKWESSEFRVRYFNHIPPGETQVGPDHGAALNDYIDPPWLPGDFVPGYGVLRNWLFWNVNRYMIFSMETPIT
ncbi:MAG: InlB B-repeat-containing protein, partial [Clostridiales bacterium]|nr:InlB B-repeat-containing protein [Clostridiales bacterium]